MSPQICIPGGINSFPYYSEKSTLREHATLELEGSWFIFRCLPCCAREVIKPGMAGTQAG